MGIKNIVFDLGGVIVDYNPEGTLAKYFDDDTARVLLRELFRNPLWAQMDRGTMTVEQVMQAVRNRIPKGTFDTVYSIVANWGGEMPPFPGICELVRELKGRGLGVYLLSNVPKSFHEYGKTIPAIQYFDGCFVSADYGLLKPEKAIYEAFLGKFSLSADECFFIDDMQANVDGAQAAGIAAYRHNGDAAALRAKIFEIIGE